MSYSKDVEFFFIYVTEAHPEQAGQRGFSPKTIEARVDFACERREADGRVKQFAVPVLVDEIDQSTQLAYMGFPARTVLVGRDGRIAWSSQAEPSGIRFPVSSGEAEHALMLELAKAPPTQQGLRAVAEEEAAQHRLFYDPPVQDAVPVLLVNCGAARDYTDKAGRLWRADHPWGGDGYGYSGGRPVTSPPHWVVGTQDWPIYTSALEGLTGYRIAVPNGRYVLRLHFAEIDGAGGRGQTRAGGVASGRSFALTAEGQTVLSRFNVLQAAGGRRYAAVLKTQLVEVADGEITVEFKQDEGSAGSEASPILSAIEVWRSP